MLNLYVYMGIYIVILLGISYIVSKKQGKEDFLIAGRNRGSLQIFLSKFAAAIGAGFFITYAGFAYEYGLGVFTMLIGFFFGYLIYGYWAAPRIHGNSKEKRFYKIGDLVTDRLKNKLSGDISNFVGNLIMLAWLLVGIIGGAK